MIYEAEAARTQAKKEIWQKIGDKPLTLPDYQNVLFALKGASADELADFLASPGCQRRSRRVIDYLGLALIEELSRHLPNDADKIDLIFLNPDMLNDNPVDATIMRMSEQQRQAVFHRAPHLAPDLKKDVWYHEKHKYAGPPQYVLGDAPLNELDPVVLSSMARSYAIFELNEREAPEALLLAYTLVKVNRESVRRPPAVSDYTVDDQGVVHCACRRRGENCNCRAG